MASYDAKINVLLSGLRDLVLLEDRLEKIGSIVNTLNKTPIALNVGGRGKERDLSGQLSKQVNDYVREWVNGGKIIGKSINAVQQQQAAFNQLLRETALVQKDPAAKNAVQNLATAWADTTRAAAQYDKKLNDIQRKALGLQPQAIRDLEVAKREAFVASGGKAARRERTSFLAGAPVSQFPIGPNLPSTRRRFEGDTSVERAENALVIKERQAQRALNAKFFAEEKTQVLELERLRTASAQKQTQQIQAIGKAVRGSLSSAAIGGAFPLLFGQSPQAAVGGALGGLIGGAGGGFAGSLIGTALGEIEAAKARTKELAIELGLTSTQAQTLATAFELAGRNSQQLEAAVTNIQGLGLSTTETASALKIAVELSKEYGGSVEKIAQSFADTLESGKVSIATLNKFTAQGIPIQDELAAKFGVSRTKLLELAKDGQISVQQVVDVLVKLGQEAENTGDKGKTGFDRFTAAVQNIATAVASAAGALLKILVPALDTVLTKLSNIITRATQAINLLTDAQVGEATAALGRSGFNRGTFSANKGNVDDLTQGLKSLQPLSAKTKEQFDRIADVAQRYRNELSQYGGSLGEYAVRTAQVELTRVQKDLNAARKTVGAAAKPDAITGISAPANLPPSGGDGGGSTGRAKKERESQLPDILAANGLFRSQETIAARIAVAEVDRNKAEVARLQYVERGVQLLYEAAAIQRSNVPLDEKQAQLRGVQDKLTASLNQYERQIAIDKIAQVKAANEIIADLKLELALKTATTEEERKRLQLAADRAKLEEQLKGLPQTQIDQITTLQAQVSAPLTDAQNIEQRIGQIKDEVAELTSISNIAIASAEGIGNAFAQSFQGLISGTLTAKEALSSFFKSVADMFLEMAAQIIAKQITMIILQTILKALGAFGGGGGGGGGGNFSNAFGSGGPTFNPEGFTTGSFGTDIAPFANGGIVSSPTLFKFADGGTTRTGLMGEAGPEAIMPLKRGADGSLGVQANGLREAMNQDRAAAGGAPVLNMSFQSTNINGVEYVSRDQLEAAMAQTRRDASRDGAQRGMSMTLDKLQQSPSTRRRVGI